jgi:hypothetical protein
MSIKAIFPAGVEALTVHGLHQWDYGQTLEITHPDLPAIIEVHFAPVGAQEAIVRVVSAAAGVAEVPVPDELLEQSRPVLAWVYLVGETSGTTMLTVTMPLQARARPTAAGPAPAHVADQYTQAVAAVNAQVESLKQGDVTVAKALAANSATTAGSATTAASATRATQDSNGSNIVETYVKKGLGLLPVTDFNHFAGEAGRVYLFCLTLTSGDVTYAYAALCAIPEGGTAAVLFGTAYKDRETYLITMDLSGSHIVFSADSVDGEGTWDVQSDPSLSLSYCPLFALPVG